MATPTPGTTTAPASTALVYAGRAAPGVTAVSRIAAFMGDSLTSQNFGATPYYWTNGLLGAPLDVVLNGGTDGLSLLGLYNQMDNLVTDTYPGLEGLSNLGWLFLRGGTNNVRYGTAPIDAGIRAIYDDITARALTYAERVVWFAVPPIGGVNIARVADVDGYNAYLQTKAAANPTRVFFVDDCTTVKDGSGNIIASCFDGDELHMSAEGTYRMGKVGSVALAALLAGQNYPSRIVTDPADVYPAQPQWHPNPTNVGTGGTASSPFTGTVPNGITVGANGAGVAGTCSIVAADVGDANTVPWLRITPTQTQNNSNISITSAGAGRAFSAGDPAEFDQIVQLRFNGFDASKWRRLRCWMQASTGGKVTTDAVLKLGGTPCNDTVTLRQKFKRLVPSAAGSTTHVIYIEGASSFSGAMGSIDIRCHSVRG